jgi:hypothetical protein
MNYLHVLSLVELSSNVLTHIYAPPTDFKLLFYPRSDSQSCVVEQSGAMPVDPNEANCGCIS